jgi:hypothetical protein
MAEILADDISTDDRRRVVGAGIRHGRAAEIADVRATADTGTKSGALTVIATRGERLALSRVILSGRDQRPDAFHTEALGIAEINADNRMVAYVAFDLDDIDAAFAELDSRYLAGEAAPHLRTWAVISRSYAAANRQELREMSPDWVNIDHRRARAFAPGEMSAYMDATWNLAPDVSVYIEAVHRLSIFGVVVTHVAKGNSQQGFEAEWREVNLSTVDGELINRCELFDEADLDAALARFDELSRPAPRLQNAATEFYGPFRACFASRDWVAFAELLADDISTDDRRRVVNAGLRHGRDAVIAEVAAIAEVGAQGVTSETVATRGDRLALSRVRTSTSDQGHDAFYAELLDVIEIDADKRVVARVVFDVDDLDAAFEELDARYLAGEAAPHSRTWSVIVRNTVAFNRRELPAATPDWVNVDHRRGTSFAPGDLAAYLHAAWDLTPQVHIYIEAVHGLNDLGAIVAHAGHATSQDGFAAEWRVINLLTVDGDLINRSEMFDEADLDAALARFEELHSQTQRLENEASRLDERFWKYFAARDWTAMAETVADDISTNDRRRFVNAGVQNGRDAHITNLRAVAEVGAQNKSSVVIATREERLALSRVRYSAREEGHEAFSTEMLEIVEINPDQQIVATVGFDPDDIDAAFDELDARYLAGEAAAHEQAWSVVAGAYTALNRRELPATTPDWVNDDHRRVTAFAPGDLIANIRAVWNQVPDIRFRIEAVHRLSDLGAVVTQAVRGTSQEGLEAEWREIHLMTGEGDLVDRSEMFDEADIDAALARFEELQLQTRRLENAACRVQERFLAHFAARNWDAVAEVLADDVSAVDRRPVMSAGTRQGREVNIGDWRTVAEVGFANIKSTIIALRGERLALGRFLISTGDQQAESFHNDVLGIVEINADNRIAACFMFDLDDIEGAVTELDARYLAGEAATHSRAWSVIARTYAAFNRRELPPTTPDWVNIDHRRATSFAPGDTTAYLRATWDVAPDINIYIEAVHRLNDVGAVCTHVAHGRSQEGFDAEWREIAVFTVEGDLINRAEIFDESDLDAALARFDELNQQVPQLENAATRTWARLADAFNRRHVEDFQALIAADCHADDRRKGLRALFEGRAPRHAAQAMFDVTPSWWPEADVVAIRGCRFALMRNRFRDTAETDQPIAAEYLTVVEISDDSLLRYTVRFDPDDINGAITELTARWIASGEVVAHPEIIEAHRRLLVDIANRHDWDTFATLSAGATFVGHRQLAVGADTMADYISSIRMLASLVRDLWLEPAEILAHSALGVLTYVVVKGTSTEGAPVELPLVILVLFDGDRVSRVETFEPNQRELAVARFEELSRPRRI